MRCGSMSCSTDGASFRLPLFREWRGGRARSARPARVFFFYGGGGAIKIGSAGKIFSLTGWKVGWMIASPELAATLARAHQFLTFSTAPNLQTAVAYGMNQGDEWIEPMRQRFAGARDRMTEGLRAGGYVVLDAAATYFLSVDLEASGIAADDET